MENDLTRPAPEVAPMVAMFDEYEQATQEERPRNERDIDYYHNHQLTAKEIAELNRKNQPVVTYNRIRRKINYLLGMERQARRDPKGFPRNPGDDEAAKAATDGIRYVCDSEDWDEVKSTAWEDILVPGTGAVMVGLKQDKYGLTPSLMGIRWDRHFADPHSIRHDYKDATYQGIVTWYDRDPAIAQWPDGKEAIETTISRFSMTSTFDDKPQWSKMWADRQRNRIRVIELYYLSEGVWHRCVFTHGGFLEDPEPSPYLDEEGEPTNPIEAQSLYVDRDLNRYGDVRDMISPQDEINNRRRRALHLSNARQVRLGSNALMGPKEVKKELALADGVLEGDDIEILQTGDMSALNINLLQDAKNEIDLLGANAALQGKNENDMSGRAILAQQQGGMVEVAMPLDRLRHLTLRVYQAIWSRIRQSWDGPRWVRVTEEQGNTRFVGFNQPVTVGQVMQERIEQDEALQARVASDPAAQQRLQAFMQSPQAQQVAEVRNMPLEIDIDIVIDEGMDAPSVEAEQFTELAKLAQSGLPIPPDILIEASALRDKEKILERLRQPDPAQQQAQQVAQELAMRRETAEIGKIESETYENMAEAERDATEANARAIETGLRVVE
ncbi:hypothetical protein [Parasphingopyxis sp.]|uniref:portal protein n=1 Tax=Parasphingopyxis sp. TaxID=1920299 RepID=UPI00263631DC|nr:hypothetical protein [Parasphingopyxis sp.]